MSLIKIAQIEIWSLHLNVSFFRFFWLKNAAKENITTKVNKPRNHARQSLLTTHIVLHSKVGTRACVTKHAPNNVASATYRSAHSLHSLRRSKCSSNRSLSSFLSIRASRERCSMITSCRREFIGIVKGTCCKRLLAGLLLVKMRDLVGVYTSSLTLSVRIWT